MPLSDKAKLAFQFFIQNHGQQITVEDIENATGWAKSTVKTYINKKWKVEVLENLHQIGFIKSFLTQKRLKISLMIYKLK
ncbi:hypothetical protein D5E88_03335 [Vibrio parahaemolyticus]|nr:hypothetical protein D5E88_03335 [Vibrio parahaemolyticus]TBT43985.1 hypothetical protein D5E79_11225 [Vibrio parahaemolyticus]TBT75258.1 hypothetical protein D5E74_05040 [Vibrio parahaemolyticus]